MFTKPFLRYSMLILAVLYGLAVLVLSIVPLSRIALGTRPDGSAPGLVEHAAILHFAVHIVVYALLACITWFALDLSAFGATNKMIALILILLLGCATEYLQHRLYDNPLELTDLFTNILSSAALFGALALWARYRKPAPSSKPDGDHVAYVLRDIE